MIPPAAPYPAYVPRALALAPALAGVLIAAASGTVAARPASVAVCHYSYGGEAARIAAPGTDSPYTVEAVQIGSYFEMRVVFQTRPADLASLKTYVYARDADAPRILQQGTWPHPAATRSQGPYGFTGLQFIYEPELEGELQYWCELHTHRPARRP
ncbi:MAG: hypothetical protein JNJ60_19380 [Rhodocyclaceae bacterium]|nr:hypothetical protein [Rhodocyclaceae bacterium]